MAKGLIQHITESLKSYPAKVFLVENNDRFLYRSDVQDVFEKIGIEITNGTQIEQRIKFEMREPDGLLILLSQDNSIYLEDIKRQAVAIEFSLANYLQSYHIPSLIELDMSVLDKLFRNQPLVSLNRKETQEFIEKLKIEATSSETEYDLEEFIDGLNSLLNEDLINWSVVSRIIAEAISKTIGTPKFEEIYSHINMANAIFQKTLQTSYHQTKNSSAVKKPRIVSKILDYLNFNFRHKKIALIVVDGLALWQYELLRNKLPANIHEEVIYSWLPSITQLSRQAIFRGDTPQTDYRQGPTSEEKLWKTFWKGKGFHEFEIVYQHEKIDLSNIGSVSKLAIVFKDLDDKMHGSTDYVDLLMLTKNWIERSKIIQVLEELILKGYSVFLTTDHGNIQAKGWRGLQGREKLGTNKSGSRSERHIEYSEKWLSDEFMANNPEMGDSVILEEQAIYFKTELSFSSKESLVTHGGAHILEVLIPFVEIKDES
ncbi:MAG: PglZ domain-containing protein [Saprospiraceae bacterium]|nr:PglZ domain-containing protein [Saprospiraceae bacterium]